MAYPYTRDLQIDSSEQSGDPVEILPFEGRSHLCAPTGVMVELERLRVLLQFVAIVVIMGVVWWRAA